MILLSQGVTLGFRSGCTTQVISFELLCFYNGLAKNLTRDNYAEKSRKHAQKECETAAREKNHTCAFLCRFKCSWSVYFYILWILDHLIGQWISYYRQCQGDRLHYFRCRQGPATGRYRQYCSWTGYLNSPKQAYFKGCVNHGFVAGVISIYDSVTSDRMYVLWGEGKGS